MSQKSRKKKKENERKAKRQEKKLNKYRDKIVKVTLKPLEPYFFGGKDANNSNERKYLIKSNEMPSQTSLFGILRYLCIENPQADFSVLDADKARMGEKSFSIIEKENSENNEDEFGKIKSISPLFLSKENDDKCLIKAPKDYDCASGYLEDDKLLTYYPSKYKECYALGEGKKIIPIIENSKNYVEKHFIAHNEKNFMNAWLSNEVMNFTGAKFYDRCDEDKEIDDEFKRPIFITQSKIGIKITDGEKDEKNFYRKEFAIMQDYSFSFFARVNFKDGDVFYKIKDKVVFMGQGKSSFSASVEYIKDAPSTDNVNKKQNNDTSNKSEKQKDEIKEYYKYYAMSDIYLGFDDKQSKSIYAMKDVLDGLNVAFIFSDIESYRQIITSNKKYIKQAEQLNMISAGSVFLVEKNDCKYFEESIKNNHLRIIGLNNVVKMSGKAEIVK